MATLSKGRQFVSGETVTPAKLNELVDNATVTAIQTADISDSQVTTAKIADANVTTAKIADANVTTAKIADANVTTAKLADANVTPAKLSQPYTLATAQNSTSGTAIDFTGVPSWAKRITVMFAGVSTNGSSVVQVQIGDSAGIETSGYSGVAANQGSSAAAYSALTSGFSLMQSSGAGVVFHGQLILSAMGGNAWSASGQVGRTDNAFFGIVAGSKTLSDTLTQVRITTANGTDTFDAGSINIAYEG